jgi:hypothetical protein
VEGEKEEKGKDAAKETAEEKAEKAEKAHMFVRQPTEAQVSQRLTSYRVKLSSHRVAMRMKDENKSVALGTAKINYMECVPLSSCACASGVVLAAVALQLLWLSFCRALIAARDDCCRGNLAPFVQPAHHGGVVQARGVPHRKDLPQDAARQVPVGDERAAVVEVHAVV